MNLAFAGALLRLRVKRSTLHSSVACARCRTRVQVPLRIAATHPPDRTVTLQSNGLMMMTASYGGISIGRSRCSTRILRPFPRRPPGASGCEGSGTTYRISSVSPNRRKNMRLRRLALRIVVKRKPSRQDLIVKQDVRCNLVTIRIKGRSCHTCDRWRCAGEGRRFGCGTVVGTGRSTIIAGMTASDSSLRTGGSTETAASPSRTPTFPAWGRG
jgi:hypothetical protein